MARPLRIKEIPIVQRYAGRAQLVEIFRGEKTRDRNTRTAQIYQSHVKFGYTLKEIADYLGIHYTTVSKAIKEAEDENLCFKTRPSLVT